jgi:hypothetical protein
MLVTLLCIKFYQNPCGGFRVECGQTDVVKIIGAFLQLCVTNALIERPESKVYGKLDI